MAERALPVMLLLSLGVITYQQVKRGNFPPQPSAFIGVAIVFTFLAVLALASPQLAAIMGLAVVIWLVLAYNNALVKPSTQGVAAR
jgi:hypothetical protein